MRSRLHALLIIGTVLLLLFSPHRAASHSPSASAAPIYYISNDGDDDNDGLSEATPWRTIDKVNAVIFEDHATILFKRGDVFRGAISPYKFPVGLTFGAYGQGSDPVIAGSVAITGWAPTTHPALGAQVYEAQVSSLPLSDAGIVHLFVNGELMTIARYPNVDAPADKNWLQVGAGAGTDAFTDPVLAAYGKPDGYWKGATLRIRDYSWTYTVLEVTAYKAATGKITAAGLGSQLPEWGYFLDGKLEELDHPGEWYYDAAAQKVYLYPPNGADPNTLLVEGATYDTGFSIGGQENETTIENLTLRHFTSYGVKIVGSDNCTVQDNTFEHNAVGIYTWNTKDLLVSNNTLDHQLRGGISLTGESTFDVGSSVAEKNRLTNTAMYPLYGRRYDGVYQGIGISLFGTAYTIRQNVIENSSHGGIVLKSGGHHLVENNVVRNALLLLNDGGALVIGADGNVIRGNFFLDTHGNVDESNGCGSLNSTPCMHHSAYGMGIGSNSKYKDNVIEGNTIANNRDIGIRLNAFINTTVRNNVLYNNDPQIKVEDKKGPSRDNLVEGNVIYSLHPEQLGLSLTNDTNHGTFDDNVYGNPYGEIVILRDGQRYSLAHWQHEFGQYDQHSRAVHHSFPEYTVTQTGTNLISNSYFDADVSGWSPESKLSHDPGKPEMDGGSLKAQYLDTSGNFNVIPNTLSITQGQWYRLRFSVIANAFGDIQLRSNRTAPDYQILEERFFAIDDTRKDYTYFFQASETTDALKHLFITKANDADTYWLDNVTFEPVEVLPNDPQQQSVLFMNPTENPATIDLAYSKYLDLDGDEVTGQFTLPPFSSQILLYVGERDALDLSPSTKTASNLRPRSGDRVTYTISIRNGAGPTARTVLMTDTLPGGLTYVPGSLTASSGTPDDSGAPRLGWTGALSPTLGWTGALSPSPTVYVSYAVTVDPAMSGTNTVLVPRALVNVVEIAVPGVQTATVTRTVTLLVDGQNIYLPMIMRDAGAAQRTGRQRP